MGSRPGFYYCVFAVLLFALSACSDDDGEGGDSGLSDTGQDVAGDVETDRGRTDVTQDTEPDASEDTGEDTADDPATDASGDADADDDAADDSGSDTGDVADDLPPDTTGDAEPDALEVGEDVDDASEDPTADAEPDAEPDATPDLGDAADAEDTGPDLIADDFGFGDADLVLFDADGGLFDADFGFGGDLFGLDANPDLFPDFSLDFDAGLQCEAAGDSCLVTRDEGDDWVCNPIDGRIFGVCMAECIFDDECGSGEICIYSSFPDTGVCVPETCSGWASDDCGDGARCVVLEDEGVCVPNGLGGEGDTCDAQSECSAGLFCQGSVCLPPECLTSGGITCGAEEPDCLPLRTVGAPPAEFEVGFCVEECEPFGVGTCDGGDFCYAFRPDLEDGTLGGICGPSGGGTAGVDESCEVNTCQDGLACINLGTTSEPLPTCLRSCDPGQFVDGQPGFCPTEQACAGVTGSSVGVCVDGCTPFIDDADCAETDWCRPNSASSSFGSCVAFGEAELGADCDGAAPATTCAADLLCVGGTCLEVCDPLLFVEGGPGSCSSPLDFCDALVFTGTGANADIGQCRLACGYVHGAPESPSPACTDDDWCVAAEVLGNPADTCLAAGTSFVSDADCSSLGAFFLCGPGSLCIDEDDPLSDNGGETCEELCFASEGELGVVGHPECEAGELCENVSLSGTWGFCTTP